MQDIETVRALAVQLEEKAKLVQKAVDEATRDLKVEKERWEKEKEEMAKRYSIEDNIIDLNVGGYHYTTYKSVLCKQEGSMLEAMFSGRHPVVKDNKDRYFIDCDGKVCYAEREISNMEGLSIYTEFPPTGPHGVA